MSNFSEKSCHVIVVSILNNRNLLVIVSFITNVIIKVLIISLTARDLWTASADFVVIRNFPYLVIFIDTVSLNYLIACVNSSFNLFGLVATFHLLLL